MTAPAPPFLSALDVLKPLGKDLAKKLGLNLAGLQVYTYQSADLSEPAWWFEWDAVLRTDSSTVKASVHVGEYDVMALNMDVGLPGDGHDLADLLSDLEGMLTGSSDFLGMATGLNPLTAVRVVAISARAVLPYPDWSLSAASLSMSLTLGDSSIDLPKLGAVSFENPEVTLLATREADGTKAVTIEVDVSLTANGKTFSSIALSLCKDDNLGLIWRLSYSGASNSPTFGDLLSELGLAHVPSALGSATLTEWSAWHMAETWGMSIGIAAETWSGTASLSHSGTDWSCDVQVYLTPPLSANKVTDTLLKDFDSSTTPISPPFDVDVSHFSFSYAAGAWQLGLEGLFVLEESGTSVACSLSLAKASETWEFAVTLAGLKLALAKNTESKVFALSPDTTSPSPGTTALQVSLREVAHLLRLDAVRNSLPDASIGIQGAFIAVEGSKKLLGLQFSFSGAALDNPIIHFVTGGGSLGIAGGTFLAATDAWTATEVQALTGALAGTGSTITLPSEVRKGPNFIAALAVGGNTVTSSLTPSGQQSGTPAPTPAPTAVTSSSATRWFEVQKKVGPLTLARAGIAMAKTDAGKPKVDVLLDASFMLGPITITLDQFGIDIPIEWPLKVDDFGISLHGLQITFDKAPLLISGGLLHTTDANKDDIYIGDVIIHTEALSLTALGEYAKMADGTTSLALLAILNDPPLGGPAFCFVTGLAAGFGYNNEVNLPTTIATLPGCPIIQALDPANGIDLEVLKTTLVPTRGHDWLALGLLFRSFEMIQSSALLIAQFGGGDLKLSLLAQSELSIPPNSAERLAYAQLDVEATLDLGTGSLLVLGVLTDKSYVIAPECKLTGGFAFLVNDKGDFLATFGGYSPDFDFASRGYPAVPRLGIQWQIDCHTAIKGEEYFAITPDCMMAGGSLHATWNCGIFAAWFNFDAHLFMQWRPLLYSVGFSMDLGVAFDLKVLFVHVHFSFHIGASIQLDGPPFHGKAHIDLDVISFTVEFGSAAPQPVLPWEEFRRLLPGPVKLDPKAPANAKLSSDALATLENTATATLDSTASPLLTAKVTSGLVKDSSQGKAAGDITTPDWIINGTEFSIHISSAIPIMSHRHDGAETPWSDQPAFGMLPMHDVSHPSAHLITSSLIDISFTAESGAPVATSVKITPAAADSSYLSTALWGTTKSSDTNARTQYASSLSLTAIEPTAPRSSSMKISDLLHDAAVVSVRPRPRSAS